MRKYRIHLPWKWYQYYFSAPAEFKRIFLFAVCYKKSCTVLLVWPGLLFGLLWWNKYTLFASFGNDKSEHSRHQLNCRKLYKNRTWQYWLFLFFFSREKREKELNEFLKQRQNRLGLRIKQRIQSINDAMTSANQELKKKKRKCL